MQRTLNRSASFWVAAAVAAIALWTSAAPSITYPLYADEWQLTPAVTTAIFAVYPIMLVPTLVIFGNLSDYIGRRSTMLLGLLANLIGVLLFALAPDVVWVFLGRAFMGIGVGLSLSPATAAVLEFSRAGHEKRAGSVTTASTAVGLVLATLVGGALIQYAPDPTHLNFMVLAVVIATVIAIAWFLPRHTAVEARGRWRPRPLSIPRGLRGYYAVAAVSVSGAYAVGGIILSLGANIARDLIQSDNAFVNGAILALNAATIGITAILARGVRPMTLVAFGGLAAVAGMALLILSSLGQSLPIFLAASVVIGVAYSFLFAGGLGIAGSHAPEHHRAGFLSAVYLVAYLVQGIVSLSLGGIATASTLGFALDMGGIVVALFGFGGVLLVLLFSRGARGARGA